MVKIRSWVMFKNYYLISKTRFGRLFLPCCHGVPSPWFNELAVGFGLNMNIMPLTPPLTCSPIPARGELNKPNRVLHGVSD